jgi:hypothetical protein
VREGSFFLMAKTRRKKNQGGYAMRKQWLQALKDFLSPIRRIAEHHNRQKPHPLCPDCGWDHGEPKPEAKRH